MQVRSIWGELIGDHSEGGVGWQGLEGVLLSLQHTFSMAALASSERLSLAASSAGTWRIHMRMRARWWSSGMFWKMAATSSGVRACASSAAVEIAASGRRRGPLADSISESTAAEVALQLAGVAAEMPSAVAIARLSAASLGGCSWNSVAAVSPVEVLHHSGPPHPCHAATRPEAAACSAAQRSNWPSHAAACQEAATQSLRSRARPCGSVLLQRKDMITKHQFALHLPCGSVLCLQAGTRLEC